MKMYRYVSELPVETQAKIKQALHQALYAIGLRGQELEESVQDGMDSKLSDLTDTIDVKAILSDEEQD